MVKRLSPTDQNNVALTNVPTPSADGDAANKSYVDGKSYPTNLTTTTAASTVTVVSDTGTDATISAATTSVAGVMSGTDKTKLDGIEAGAQVNTVTSVSNKTGAVTLTKSDVGLGSVDDTSNATERAAAATLTNKRIDPRVYSTTSAASLTPTVASYDQYIYTALTVNLTINAPAGTPVNGNKLLFAIKDSGTSRTLAWNAAFAPVGIDMPTSTTAGKWHYVGFIYNAAAAKWHCIAATEES